MTAKQQLELFAISQNPALETYSLFLQLYTFTKLAVKNARDLARSGQKDSARNWSRFFQNAQIYKLLKNSGAVGPEKLEELRQALIKLNGECHPQDVPAWETDIQAIRASLEQILSLMAEKQQPVFPFASAISPARSGAGVNLSEVLRN